MKRKNHGRKKSVILSALKQKIASGKVSSPFRKSGSNILQNPGALNAIVTKNAIPLH